MKQNQEEQRKAINTALDETRDNIRRSADEARNQIPRYIQLMNEYQEQSIQAVKEIADSYIESQREIINSAWNPFVENNYGTNYNAYYAVPPFRMSSLYVNVIKSFADNMIVTTRLANNIMIANMELFKAAMQLLRENTKNLYGMSVNAAKTFERSSRDANRQMYDVTSNSDNYWQQKQQQRRYEEGVAGTRIERTSDSTKEYESKEPMSPAKIQEHEPTAVKREMTEKIGESNSVPERAKKIARRSGMAKGTAGAAETGSEYEQGTAGANK